MKTIGLNVLMNTALAVILVSLSNRALANGLEETLVSLALLFGVAVVVANCVYVVRIHGPQQTDASRPSQPGRS